MDAAQLQKENTRLKAALHARDVKLAKRRAQVRRIHGHIRATPGHPFLRWMREADKRREVEEEMVQFLIGNGHDACLPEYAIVNGGVGCRYGENQCAFCKVLTPYNLARVYVARHGEVNYRRTQHYRAQGACPTKPRTRNDTVSTPLATTRLHKPVSVEIDHRAGTVRVTVRAGEAHATEGWADNVCADVDAEGCVLAIEIRDLEIPQ